MGKRVRARSPRNVVDEIEFWVRSGYRVFNIADDNFTFYKNRVYEICDEIEKRKLGKLELRCHNGIRPDRTDRDLLKRMKQVGFGYIQVSVESASQKMLDNMKKGEKIEVIKRTIEDAVSVGMEVQLAFVIGTPGETWEDMEESFALARNSLAWRADHNHLYPHPKTELYEWAEKNRVFIKPPEEYLNDEKADYKTMPVLVSEEFSLEQRILAGKTFQKISRELYKKALKRKFKSFGIMGEFVAFIFTTGLGRYLFYGNRFSRKMIDSFRLFIDNINKAK
jgi:radical SAM superfamily enzyme YgiQ (UPF0313 family)